MSDETPKAPAVEAAAASYSSISGVPYFGRFLKAPASLRAQFEAPFHIPEKPPQRLLEEAAALGYELIPKHRIKTCHMVEYLETGLSQDIVFAIARNLAHTVGREIAHKLLEFDKIKLDTEKGRRRLSCSISIIVPD